MTQVEDAMRAYFADAHQLAEGAGAAPLAALMTEGDRAGPRDRRDPERRQRRPRASTRACSLVGLDR